MNTSYVTLFTVSLIVLGIYLFVSAPAPLPLDSSQVGPKVSIKQVLTLVAQENDVIRTLYTREIVGQGKKVGLAFSEDWRERKVNAGPLPALFLREVSKKLRSTRVRLGLFLGAEYPISASNKFEGRQLKVFRWIVKNRSPQFFFNKETKQHTAMFPDFASAKPCVRCHNSHPDSSKKNWRMNDVMGATTWSYPKGKVTLQEALAIIRATRSSFRYVYKTYLTKVKGFAKHPRIGKKWPREGFYLPSTDVFMDKFSKSASSRSITRLLRINLP